MDKLNEILSAARERASAMQLPYAGALTPAEAWELWRLVPNARLVDVRTRAEWDWVGRIPQAIEIEWQFYPDSQRNPDFLMQLEQQVAKDEVLMFICRSGFRSHDAANLATDAGFSACYNVLEGFEGAVDSHGQRGGVGGWRFAGLPWRS